MGGSPESAMQWRRYLGLVKQAGSDWVDDRASSMGAALSYYTVFSIAPLLLIVISVAGLVFGREAAEGAIVTQLGGLVGTKGAAIIQELLRSVAQPKQGIINTVIGVVLVLLGATTVLAELQDDLNRIWKVPAKARPSGVWGWVRSRLLSIGMILAIGFLLLVSLAASAAISALGEWSTGWLKNWEVLAHFAEAAFSYLVVTALFALIYRFLPDEHIAWRDVWIGAAVTGALFTLGKFLIGLYIGKSAVTSGFGAAGSLAVLLVWVYYSAQIFLLGAEFTAVYAHGLGSKQGQQRPEAAAPGVAKPAGDTPPRPTPASASAAAPLSLPQPQPEAGGGWLKHAGATFAGSAALGAAAVMAVRQGMRWREPAWKRAWRHVVGGHRRRRFA
jgi:membrane protein